MYIHLKLLICFKCSVAFISFGLVRYDFFLYAHSEIFVSQKCGGKPMEIDGGKYEHSSDVEWGKHGLKRKWESSTTKFHLIYLAAIEFIHFNGYIYHCKRVLVWEPGLAS